MHIKQEEYTFDYVKEKLITIYLEEEFLKEYKILSLIGFDAFFKLCF